MKTRIAALLANRRPFAAAGRASSRAFDGSSAFSPGHLGKIAVLALLATAALLALAAPALAAEPSHPLIGPFGSAAQPSFGQPAGMTVDPASGDLLVIDFEDQALSRYHADGTPADFSALSGNTIDGHPGEADEVPVFGEILGNYFSSSEVEVAVAPPGSAGGTAGDIYVTDARNEEGADVFAPSGEYLGQVGSGYVCGIAVGPDGDVYLGDYYNGEVHKLTPSSPTSFSPSGDFSTPAPCQLAAGTGPSAGYVFAAEFEGEVAKIDSEGAEEGETQYIASTGANTTLSVDPGSGHLFAAKGEEVLEFDASGSSEATQAAHPIELDSAAEGVAANEESVYVARAGHGEVEEFGTSFGEQEFKFKVLEDGNGSGAVECEVNGGPAEPCPETNTLYPEGTEVVLTATAAAQSVFAGFSGGGCSTSPCTLALEANTTVTATFNQMPPSVENNAPGTITQTTAVLNGHVNNNGDALGSACKFVLALEEPPHTVVAEPACNTNPVTGSANTAVTATVGNLNAATSYVYRVLATNTGGTSTGEPDVHFTTLVGPPRIFAQSASSLGTAAAVLAGYVNPSGLTTSYHFEYDTTPYDAGGPPHGTEVPLGGEEIGDGTVAVFVSRQIEELSADTTYHFRLLATNSAGTTKGHDTTFTTARTDSSCPNAAIRAEQGPEVLALPDCMALEQVSPSKKNNQHARLPSAISADGKRVLYNSLAAIGDSPMVNTLFGAGLLATRDASGWASQGVNAPFAAVENAAKQFQISNFSPDLSRWLVFAGRYYEGQAGGIFSPLSPPLINLADAQLSPQHQGLSADRSRLYLRPQGPRFSSYLPGDPLPAGAGGDYNLYVAQLDSGANPSLALFARDRDGKAWGGNCGVRLGGIQEAVGAVQNGYRNQGAISANGGHVYFSTRPAQAPSGECTEANRMRIMERVETPSGPAISELIASECDRVSPPCAGSDGDDLYQGASIDQTKVYFTTNRQLADTDLDGSGTSCSVSSAVSGCDLYLYDWTKPAAQRLTQVSAGENVAGKHEAGKGANLYNSIAGISADGSHVYFVAQGVLTGDPNPEGDIALAGQPNFYAWNATTRATAFIGTVAGSDSGRLWGGDGTWRDGAYPVPILGEDDAGHQLGGDGHLLFFKSRAPLTAGDGDGAFLDLFRYDAEAGTLQRVSRAGPGGSDDGAFNVTEAGVGAGTTPSGTDYAESGRSISDDGETLAFTTVEPLLPGDTNGVEDVYMRRKGELYRLPGSARANTKLEANTPVVSADGSTVAYHGTAQLVSSDGDSAQDVYVARVDGGFPNVIPVICTPDGGEGCQGPAAAPASQSAAACAAACGNVVERPRCRKGFVRRHGKCVKRHRKRKHHRSSHRRAGAHRGAGR